MVPSVCECECAVCVDALPASALGESSCNAADAANNTRQPQAAAAAAAASSEGSASGAQRCCKQRGLQGRCGAARRTGHVD